MAEPIISVILPCYNGERFLERALSSVLGQTFQEIEVVLVDDGSTDRSAEIAMNTGDDRVKVIRQKNRGVSAARNRGISESAGIYLAFLDADDTWDKTCLEKQYHALEKNPNAHISYCGWQNIGLKGGRGLPYIPTDYEKANKWEELMKGCPWPIHAALSRREAILTVGGFDETLKISEDYAMWLRLAFNGSITRVAQVLAFYHFHEGTHATLDTADVAISTITVQKKFLSEKPSVEILLGKRRAQRLIHDSLLERGFHLYWNGNLSSARRIFRQALKERCGSLSQWKYMLPALLPIRVHMLLLSVFRKTEIIA